ncbi:MAG: SH3 domain-containing protein [Chloroflexi bacterium]|nr:SH3 domain-containing protein [Chloroflexota bacterium]
MGERTGWASGRFLTISVAIDQIPVQGSVFDQIDGVSDIGARAYPRAAMRIRTRPSTRMPVIGEIPWGGEAELIGRTVQAGTDRWYQIRYNGIVGWIDARWVTARGEMYQVPIR